MKMFSFGFFDDNGTTTYICAKCRKEAIEIYIPMQNQERNTHRGY